MQERHPKNRSLRCRAKGSRDPRSFAALTEHKIAVVRLPDFFRTLIELLGFATAARLVLVFGGRRVYVPNSTERSARTTGWQNSEQSAWRRSSTPSSRRRL